MMPARRISDDALVSAVMHLVGQSRAYLQQVEGALTEIDTLHDDRARRLVEALELTLGAPARPGTLRHLEQAATALLRSLRDDPPAARSAGE
jgi:hypothetical protein